MIYAIGRMGPHAKGAVPALILRGQREPTVIQRAAADALGRIGPDAKAAIPALEALLGEAVVGDSAKEAIDRIHAK